jgi:hypothetical protein
MSQPDSAHDLSVQPPEPHAPKRPISERKILANRKNSLRSTGPRTPRGKSTASRNSIKHGLLAREVAAGQVFRLEDGETDLVVRLRSSELLLLLHLSASLGTKLR